MNHTQYYYVNQQKFNSKIQALEYSIKVNKKPHFFFDDNFYSKIDWTVEPPGELDFYYLERAKQIRDSYDYVILAYSGGYDSTNILETFYHNNLRLDKIITVGAFSQDTQYGSDENHNGELYHNAIPYLKELGLMDRTEMIDYTKTFNECQQFSLFNKTDMIDNLAAWISPNNWFWRDIERYVVPKEWLGKKIAIVFGREKPTLYDANYSPNVNGTNLSAMKYFCFNDKSLTNYGGFLDMQDAEIVNFYWDKNCHEILIKQLHTIYKYTRLQSTIAWNKNLGTQVLDKSNINNLIYNLKYSLKFKSPKSPSTIFSLRDTFLNKTSSDIYDIHLRNQEQIHSRVGVLFERPIFSKLYKFIK